MELTNWPLTGADVRKAISGGKPPDGSYDEADLDLWAAFVSELVDARTGRDEDPMSHVITKETPGGPEYSVPVAFVMAGRVTANLLWKQERRGGGRSGAEDGVPMGAGLPSKAKDWLKDYPPTPGIA